MGTIAGKTRSAKSPSKSRRALRAWIAEDPQRARAYIEERVQMVPWSGCWLWDLSLANGYGQFIIKRGGRQSSARAHIAAYEAFVGPVPDGLILRHKCDVPACCNPDHLEFGTFADNSRDMVERGRACCGDARPTSKIRAKDVRRIVADVERGVPRPIVAARHGVSEMSISNVMTGRTWSHITGRVFGARKPRPTRELVLDIVERYRAGETVCAIARERGLSHPAVSRIVNGRAWSAVTGITPRERTPADSRTPQRMPGPAR